MCKWLAWLDFCHCGGKWWRFINICSLDRHRTLEVLPNLKPWEINKDASLFLLIPFHHSFLHISTLCPKILNLLFLLLSIIECLRLEHVSLLMVQYAQWEKFVIQVVAVGEIQRSSFPSVPEASVAWTSVCINETCHLHCVGFYIPGGSRGGNPKEASISPTMSPLCAPSCMTQRPNPPDHLWPPPWAQQTQVLNRPSFHCELSHHPLLYLEKVWQT